ncbi:MAG: response regulator [Planctomycetota bacterium]|jgi:DNA-binding NtrC family response regulator
MLVVGGSRNIGEFCERELEREGYRVLLAADPYEALLMLDVMALDLVVTDLLEAQGMDLPTFLSRLKNRGMPVIIHTTSKSCPSDQISSSVEAYIEESGDLVVLKREIKKVLQCRAARRAAFEN